MNQGWKVEKRYREGQKQRETDGEERRKTGKTEKEGNRRRKISTIHD